MSDTSGVSTPDEFDSKFKECFIVITGIHVASKYFGDYKDAGIFSFTSTTEPVAINSNDFWLGVCCPCLKVLEVKVILEFQNLCQ